ncbi:hypothetical protein K1T71_004172 [Dendrolimus kikuchii]|uniref:Uncharacterized protein n=1 Tax=Dendrolimus kikuchii TaxID=765133 RepID=A0ACC1DA11_9NEOP|nr:hypothetical protein K1T71_004172 [Dendrolimus kikuchii]
MFVVQGLILLFGVYFANAEYVVKGQVSSYGSYTDNNQNKQPTLKCEVSCKNNGICIDTNTCLCHPNYYGQHCEFKKKSCMTFPPLLLNSRRQCTSEMCTITCMEGYKFVDGTSVANIKCVNGEWQPTRADLTSIPDCEPVCNPSCQNGGICLGVNTCQCPADYRGPQCQYRKCEISCKNNGICIDTNTCLCDPNYYGQHCEFKKKSCMTFPPLLLNSRRQCTSEMCTITCMEGYKFVDGTSVANIKCVNGEWQPTRADLTSIPDCEPVCNPSCQNGGICLGVNTCQCPADYRGPQCQYHTSVCDVRKLAFNGSYNCSGDAEKFSCRLTCPAGSKYSTHPADIYTCLYSTGTFQPQPIPHCGWNEMVKSPHYG